MNRRFTRGTFAALAVVCTGVIAGTAVNAASPAMISPGKLTRLKAAGLDPGDPQLARKLQALAASKRFHARGRVPSPTSFASKTTTFQIHLPPVPRPSGAPFVPGSVAMRVPPQAPFNVQSVSTTFGPGTNAIKIVGTGLAVTSAILKIDGCGTTQIPVPSANATMPNSNEIDFKNLPYVTHDADSNLALMAGSVVMSSIPIRYAAVITPSGSPTMFENDQVSSAPSLMNSATLQALAGSEFASTVPGPRMSTDPAAAATTGTDILRHGVALLNGWTAASGIIAVSSYLDGPDSQLVNDVFRSATVTQGPQGGRLDTKVAWMYEGGESVEYEIIFSFRGGTYGTRYDSDMPKQTSCADEQ